MVQNILSRIFLRHVSGVHIDITIKKKKQFTDGINTIDIRRRRTDGNAIIVSI